MAARKRRSARSGRKVLHSAGRPPVARREHRRAFWLAVAMGRSSDDAAMDAGVSPPVGARWFREAGGMPASHLAPSSKPPSGRYPGFAEREEIALLRAQGHGVRELARRLGRTASTLSRELRRNAATRSGGFEYRATTAEWHADRAARRPKPAQLAVNATLREYVQERLAGRVTAPSGEEIRGPRVLWKGRRKGRRQDRRQDRRWARAWSPEQIAHRLRLDVPEDETMRVSHEAICQALDVQGRGALKRELTSCLRTGRALRLPRSRAQGRGKSFLAPEVMISERPAEATDRAVPGHWEGDLIPGLSSSAIGTLVERTTRFTMLLASAAHARSRQRAAGEERACPCRSRCRGGARCHRERDHDAARAAAPVTDMGPGRGDGQARRAAHRHRASRLLLRSPQSPPQPPGCGPSRHRIDGLLAINGSGRPARTRMGSCASTFRKAPTLARTQPTSSPP